mgnify:CR=1 FL=1
MHKIWSVILLGVVTIQLPGCGSDTEASESGITVGTPIVFQVSEGIQTDIMHQRIDVIDDSNSYNLFLLSISSISGNIPNFDESIETLIGILSNEESCVFKPVVTEVIESVATISIKIINERIIIPVGAVCDPLTFQFFSYNIVKIAKTIKPISVIIENESF